ncbi:MAG: hypothetical protein AAF762_11560 [Pseudomonadota bacterium]
MTAELNPDPLNFLSSLQESAWTVETIAFEYAEHLTPEQITNLIEAARLLDRVLTDYAVPRPTSFRTGKPHAH